jgi:hypothetical protein
VVTTSFGNSNARDITIDVRDLIREYIRSYPTGITLIKEFIQNADDAGATELAVVLDRREHPDGLLRDPRMKRLLGPSLLISNDALFTEDDHRGITTLLNSGKRRESGKTGRFGIGFNCCYNVTDFPSFVSGSDIVCLDPCYGAVRHEGEPRTVREPLAQLWDTDEAWLKTFSAMGIPFRAASVPFTVFRLPLRREEIAPPDPITPKTLSFEDFAQMLNELKAIGAELLLFTKHVLKLKLGHIGEGGQAPDWDLIIETADPVRVTKGRKPLVDALRGDPMELLTKLDAESNPPIVRYAHTFNIKTHGSARQETWMVLGGLFCGTDNRLIHQARAMLRLGEKAIPLAGCAAKIVKPDGIETISVVPGRLYCGLPINRETPLGFHANSYFDTDSSRTDITRAEGLQGDDRKRAEWNLLLLEDAIGPCAAEMIRTFIRVSPDTAPEALYKIFPKLSDVSELFRPIATSFYKSLVDSRVIAAIATGQQTWENIANVWIVPPTLRDPLVADGFVVAAPNIPSWVKMGFTDAGTTLNVLEPQTLRQHLFFDSDVDCTLESAPKSSLQKREWVQEMLKFCCDAEKPELLDGLALAILADGRLHTFGKTDLKWVFVATQEQRDIFASQPQWFIDSQFCEAAGLSPQARGPLRRMSGKDFIEALRMLLEGGANVPFIERDSAAKSGFSEEWLATIFYYLAKVPGRELADPHSRAILGSLYIVPDQSRRLHRLGQPSTPLLRSPQPTKSAVMGAFSTLGVPFVTGTDDLIDAVSQFATTHPGFIGQFDANAAAFVLKANGLAKTSFDENVHDVVIDFLANAYIGGDVNDPAASAIASLPIIPTNGHTLVAAGDLDVYLPPSFDLAVDFPATLVRRGPRDVRVPLLRKLGVQELTLATVISRFISQTYPTLSEDKKLSLLQWIRNVYYDIERRSDTNGGETRACQEELSKLDFIRCSDGRYRAAGKLYLPSAAIAIEVLGSGAKIPCTETYKPFETSWADFFRKCGVATLPRTLDILNRVKELSLGPAGPERSKALLRVAKFLGEHLERYSKSSLPDGKLLLQALKEIEWLPALKADKFKHNPTFTPPAKDLFRPKDIYAHEMLSLIGNIHPVLADQTDLKLRDQLGVPHVPAFEDVCRQLERMSERILRHGAPPENLRGITAAFENIYRHFGKDTGAPHSVVLSLSKRFAQVPCILDKIGKLWLAKHVFTNECPCFGGHRLHFPTLNSDVGKGVDRLGRRPSPSLTDYLEFLDEVASHYKEQKVPLSEASRLLDLYEAIAPQLGDRCLSPKTPLLTGALELRSAAALFREDTTRYRARLPEDIYFVDSRLPIKVADAAGVPVLSRCITETLLSTTPFRDQGQVEPLLACIRSRAFGSALQRLGRKYLQQPIPSEVMARLHGLRIECCSEIKTRLMVRGVLGSVDAGTGNTDSFYEPDTNRLLLCLSSDEADQHFAKGILAIVDSSQRIDVSSLFLLLTSHPSRYDTLLNMMDAPPLPEPDIIANNEDDIPVNADGKDEGEALESFADEQPDWESMSQQPIEPEINGDSDLRAKPMTRMQLRSDIPVSPPSQVPIERPPQNSSVELQLDAASISGAPIRLQNLPESSVSTNFRPQQPPLGARTEQQLFPHRGSNPFSAHRSERVVTYVEPELPNAEDPGEQARDAERIAIGNAAELAVVNYELKHERTAVRMQPDNPGYDVYVSKGQSPEPERYIEVKGTDGEWDQVGVTLTKPQFEMAKDSKNYWLYVVEWARTGDPKVYPIRDPYSRIGQFRFDSGWKRLAESEQLAVLLRPIAVKPGDRVQFTHAAQEHTGTVRELKGALRLIVIETDTGELIEKLPTSPITLIREI